MQTIKTLIVEDDDEDFEKFEDYLLSASDEEFSFLIHREKDGREALKTLKSSEYGLVILDMQLEHLSGEKILQKIHPIRPNLPIIAASAQRSVSELSLTMDFGAVDFVPKNVYRVEFVARVRNALRNAAKALSGSKSESEREDKDESWTWGKITIVRLKGNRRGPVTYDGKNVLLGPIGFAILFELVKAQGKTVDFEVLRVVGWPNQNVGPELVYKAVGRVLDALEKYNVPRSIIHVTRMSGYELKIF